MTTDRFIMQSYSIWDTDNENRRVSTKKAYRLLNELNNENEYLKRLHNDCLKGMDTLTEINDEVHKENETLKEIIKTIMNQIDVEFIKEDNDAKYAYSARIIFNKKEFDTIYNIWRDKND